MCVVCSVVLFVFVNTQNPHTETGQTKLSDHCFRNAVYQRKQETELHVWVFVVRETVLGVTRYEQLKFCFWSPGMVADTSIDRGMVGRGPTYLPSYCFLFFSVRKQQSSNVPSLRPGR